MEERNVLFETLNFKLPPASAAFAIAKPPNLKSIIFNLFNVVK